LFFKEKGLFGKECTGISQNINTESLIINNLIEFQDGRRFSVDGKINIDSGKLERINFAFSGATITIPPFNVPLPPVGKVHTYVCMYICMYIHKRSHTFLHTFIHTHKHTHIHT
jgi:hypothetical protein